MHGLFEVYSILRAVVGSPSQCCRTSPSESADGWKSQNLLSFGGGGVKVSHSCYNGRCSNVREWGIEASAMTQTSLLELEAAFSDNQSKPLLVALEV